MNRAVGNILRDRMLILHVHRNHFNPFRITEMKALRQSLFEEIKATVMQVVPKIRMSYSDPDTRLYRLEKDGNLIGQVAVTPVRRFWLEVEVYSANAARHRFIKEWTCTYFPTIDTQGYYLAVDQGVKPVPRVKHSVCMSTLKQQIKAICVPHSV